MKKILIAAGIALVCALGVVAPVAQTGSVAVAQVTNVETSADVTTTEDETQASTGSGDAGEESFLQENSTTLTIAAFIIIFMFLIMLV